MSLLYEGPRAVEAFDSHDVVVTRTPIRKAPVPAQMLGINTLVRKGTQFNGPLDLVWLVDIALGQTWNHPVRINFELSGMSLDTIRPVYALFSALVPFVDCVFQQPRRAHLLRTAQAPSAPSRTSLSRTSNHAVKVPVYRIRPYCHSSSSRLGRSGTRNVNRASPSPRPLPPTHIPF